MAANLGNCNMHPWTTLQLLCLVTFILFQNNGFVQAFSTASAFTGQDINLTSPPSSYRWSMKLRVGILGLPNVGKSSLFNALARQSLALAANFPFCTIDPNVCQVPILDPYLSKLGALAKSQHIRPATIEWVDVAGLAKNAHRGEGLGNQFLGTLRDCSILCHVVRVFEDPQVVHIDGQVDPLQDLESIQLELLLADQAHVQRRLERTNVAEEEVAILERIATSLQEGIPARALGLTSGEQKLIKSMGLLTLKPVLYAVNVDEVDFLLDRESAEHRAKEVLQNLDQFDPSSDVWTLVSAKVESELAQSSAEEQVAYLASIGVPNDEIAKVSNLLCYQVLPILSKQLLGYSLVYTGPGVPPERSQTTRAHLITASISEDDGDENTSSAQFTADNLAGRIHGEIQRGFLRAEVVDAPTLLSFPDVASAKDAGSVRFEGRDYPLQDGDVVYIKWKNG